MANDKHTTFLHTVDIVGVVTNVCVHIYAYINDCHHSETGIEKARQLAIQPTIQASREEREKKRSTHMISAFIHSSSGESCECLLESEQF